MKSALLLFCMLLIAGGCGTFEPRNSAAPTSFSSGFNTYQDVLDEIEIIYTAGRPENMSTLLSDNGFLFEADSLDSIAVSALFRTWGKPKESQVTATILADTMARIAANFNPVSSILYSSSDSVVVEWSYAFSRRDSVHIRGISTLTLIRSLSRFYLLRWKDRSDPSAASGEISWGRWKMEHVQ